MKRLQFRHHDEIFNTREKALQHFADIVDTEKKTSDEFGLSLYAEPMVAKYLDENNNEQIILAIGVDGGHTPYHIIDSKYIKELIIEEKLRAENIEKVLEQSIKDEKSRAEEAENSLLNGLNVEIARATAKENELNNSIESEQKRAETAEQSLLDNLNSEIARAKSNEFELDAKIDNNKTYIVKVTNDLDANVLEEYHLYNNENEKLGESIKIYKDNSLVGAINGFKGAKSVERKEDGSFSLTYNESERDENIEFLYLIYNNENGELQLVGIDFEHFLLETEVGNGLQMSDDHVVSIKVKSGEKYLNVTNEGIQTVNIDEMLKSAIETLDNNITSKIDTEIARSKEADNFISATTYELSASVVSEISRIDSNMDSENKRAIAAESHISGIVTSEIVRSKEADETISNTIHELSGSVVSEISRIDSNIDDEHKRAVAVENYISGIVSSEIERAKFSENALETAIDNERAERENSDASILSEVISNKVSSKDLNIITESTGTTIEIKTDEDTITKFGSAISIYESGVTVLSSLLKIKEVEPTNSAVRTRYELQGKSGQILGDAIEIFKDSALISVKPGREGDTIDSQTGAYITYGGEDGATMMNFVYRYENGIYELAQIKISDYFTDTYFGKGLNNQNGVISLKEGDGNEFLTIGEDTISVVGVSTAIHSSEERCNSYADNKSNMAVEASNKYTDDKVTLLTSTINTSVESMNSTLDNAVASMNNTFNTAIESTIATVNSNIANVQSSLDGEIANRTSRDSEFYAKFSALTENNISLSNNINNISSALTSKIDNVARDLTDNFKASDSVILTYAQQYTDSTVNNAKVKDVKYNSEDKKVILEFVDGSTSEGFSASDFLVDGALKDVTFNNDTNIITFIWNADAGDKIIEVPLNKFVDQYTVSSDSVSFLKISSDNKVSTIVDNGDGYLNTLATTNFVNNATDKSILGLRNELTNEINRVNNETISILSSNIASNKQSIDKLNGEKTEMGSVRYLVDNELDKSLISDDVTITPDDFINHHSLIRKVNVNGETHYMVSSRATDMYYVSENGETKLNDYITSLRNDISILQNYNNELDSYSKELEKSVKALETEISNMKNNFETSIKDIVKNYLIGIENEIKVSEVDEKLTIGFDDNAIFGEI